MIKSRKQNGMTMWGILGLVFIGITLVFLFFKLLPPYIDDWQAGAAIKRTAVKANARSMTPTEIRETIEKQFDVDNVRHLDVKKDIVISPKGNGKLIQLEYEIEIPLVGNLSALLYFDHEAEVR